MCGLLSVDIRWPQSVATSPWMPPEALVLWNFLLAVTFLAFQILHFSDNLDIYGGFYFIYLTNLTLLLETMAVVCLFISSLWGYIALTKSSEEAPAPLFVRFSVVLWYMAQPLSLIVVLLYWTIVNEFWDPYPIILSSWWAHLIDWLILFTSFWASNIPYSFKNITWSLIYGSAYLVWTIIHYFLQIGTGETCEPTPPEECPIYDAFDWNNPGQAIGVSIGALVAIVVVGALYTGLARCRSCNCCGGTSLSKTDVAEEA